MHWYSRCHSPDSVFDLLLRQCSSAPQCKQVHARIVFSGALHESPLLSARLIAAYSRIGLLADALAVFRGADDQGSRILWNSVLRASLSHGCHGDALDIYSRMRVLGLFPDGFTLPLIVRCCSAAGNSALCKAVHGHAVVFGYSYHLHVANELILMHGTRGELSVAKQLFERMPQRNIISWNSLIAGFAAAGDSSCASEIFRRMESEGVEPSPVSWTSLLSAHARSGNKSSGVLNLFREMVSRGTRPTPESLSVVLSFCTEMGSVREGKIVHSMTVRDGLERYVFLRNSLISFYGMLGDTELEAELLFAETERKNLVTWNSIISCHAALHRHEKALQLLAEMLEMTKIRPNTVTWSAVIGGLAAGGRLTQSLEIFRRMLEHRVRPNAVTLVTLVSSCAELSALRLGREIHGHAVRSSREETGPNLLENGLISMYAKCGALQHARQMFDEMPIRDLISWNAMISAYGINGLGREALSVFYEMVGAGVDPDEISYVAVLSACAHAGLVADGRRLFQQMQRPSVEHYACMVDLLGRAGHLEEAHLLVEQMPMKPNVFVWGALLRSCKMHGDADMAEAIGERIISLGEGVAGSCTMLANVYAACGRWEEAGQVRVMMRRKELRKSPGQSWIEVDKVVHVFSAGALLKPEMEVVYQLLEDLNQLMERWE